jgi:hypothetical protein
LCAFAVLQRPLSQVVRLFGVEGQDAVRHLHLGDDQRHDGPAAQSLHRFQPVVAVGRPVLAFIGAHRDHRIEKAVQLIDGDGQLVGVRLRQIALEGCRLDPVDGQAGQHLPVAAQRVFIGPQHRAAILFDRLGQARDFGRRRRRGEAARREAAGLGLGGRRSLLGHTIGSAMIDDQ